MQKILIVIGGGIAAYKSLELIRELKRANVRVEVILTKSGEKFVTPLSIESLSGNKVHTSLWEEPMAHISLARGLSGVIVAPATAGLLSRMANGMASDLASTAFLALPPEVPIFAAPAMNPQMWNNKAVQANVKTLKKRGVNFIDPCKGDTACGEDGVGRMAEPAIIAKTVLGKRPLQGKRAIVTSGATLEAIDPVRVITNRSSGKQGHAIASALADAGASVTLISGAASIGAPENINLIKVESAKQMLKATQDALPADIFIGAAAVADWSPVPAKNKIKKSGGAMPEIKWQENEDIVKSVAKSDNRPALVIAFAAETQNLIKNARAKLKSKGADFVIANEVGGGKGFDAQQNQVYLLCDRKCDKWPLMDKSDIANKLILEIQKFFKGK